MSLQDILVDIATEIGSTNGDADRNVRISKINKAAREIHRSTDLEEAMDEIILDLNNENASQIAMPSYVFQVRGARYVDGRTVISLEDMRNRYNFNFSGENEVWYFQFRERRRSPLSRDISNQSVIRVEIPIANGEAWSITLTGRTDNSYRVSETLEFSADDLSKTGTLDFIELESAVRSQVIQYDTSLYDVEDNLLGIIPNSQTQTSYKIYQIADTENFTQPANASGIEVRFKYEFQPFKNLDDCFLGTSKYDDAIYWKFLEHRCKDPKEVKIYFSKCKMILDQHFSDEQAGKRSKMNFRPQPYYQLPYGKTGRTSD